MDKNELAILKLDAVFVFISVIRTDMYFVHYLFDTHLLTVLYNIVD